MNTSIIVEIIKELLEKIGASYDEVVVSEDGRMGPKITVKTRDSGILIGPRGEHLNALSHVIKKIAGKKIGQEKIDIIIDVNDYQEHALKSIKDKALMIAERAKSFKTSIEMDPMTAYERMIVHTALEGMPNITTESSGFGKNRKVVVKYVETI